MFLGDKLSADTIPYRSISWLAECHGELLLIVIVRHSPRAYHVFRWQSGERKWVRSTSLGDCSLFVNGDQFAGSLGPDHPAVRRDCLYFTWCSGKWSEYSLVDDTLHEFVADYPRQAAQGNYRPPPVWVLPSICSFSTMPMRTVQNSSRYICSIVAC